MEQIWGPKVKVTENENVTNYTYIFVKSGSIYVKPRQERSTAHSTHIVEYISPAKMRRFVIIWL